MLTAEIEGERVYKLGGYGYLQFNGKGEIPEPIAKYMRTHNGQMPPFMLLPDGPVEFRLPGGYSVPWNGVGELPEEVMQYVQNEGCLPRYVGAGEEDLWDEEEEEEEDDEWD